MLFVPYQRGDSGVPPVLSKLQRSSAIISPEVDVTARSKELRCAGRMPNVGCAVERGAPGLWGECVCVCERERERESVCVCA